MASALHKSDFGHTLITFGPNQSFKSNSYPQLLSEIILIGIGSAIVIWEYRRSSAKDEAKAEAAEREKEEVRGKITDLEFIVSRQSVQIKELTRYGHCTILSVVGQGPPSPTKCVLSLFLRVLGKGPTAWAPSRLT